jgi:hypothetical protein
MLSFSSLFYIIMLKTLKINMWQGTYKLFAKISNQLFFLQLSFISLLFIPMNKIKRKSLTCRLLSEKSALLKLNNWFVCKGYIGVGNIENKVNWDN